MGILKNALQGIWHHKMSSFLILALSLTVATESFQLSALIEGTDSYLNSYHQKMMTEVCIKFQYNDQTEKDASGWRIATPIESSALKKLNSLPHVTGHNYATYRGTQIQSMLDFYKSTSGYETTSGIYEGRQNTYNAADPNNPFLTSTAVIDSVSDTTKLGEFTYGGYKIVSGRPITEADKGKNVILVLDYAAQTFNWKVGDKVKLTGSYKKQGTVEAAIVGIFHDQYSNMQVLPNSLVYKISPEHSPSYIGAEYDDTIIYAPYDMMDNAFWKGQWKPGNADIAYFYIDDTKNVANFIKEAKNILGADRYSISVNSQKTYDRLYGGAATTLSGTEHTTAILILICSAAIILICLLSVMRRKGRFERMIKDGLSRRQIGRQVAVETLLLVLIPFVIATFIHGSNLLDVGSKSVAAVNNKNQLTSVSIPVIPEQVILGQFIPDNIVQPFGKLVSSVTPAALGKYFLLGLIICGLSCLISTAYIINFRMRNQKQNNRPVEEPSIPSTSPEESK